MNMLRRKKKISLPQGAVPAIRKSICTGEETFGYIKDNHFTSLRLIHSRDDVESREIDSNNTGKAEKIANIEFKTMFKTARNPFKSFKVREKCEQIV